MKEYALYKGDKFIAVGTISEIARQVGAKRETIAYYKTQAHRNKLAKRKNSKNSSILVEIDYEEKEEEYLKGLTTKICTSCDKRLPATKEYFHQTNSAYGDGLRNICKDCRNNQIKINRTKPKTSLQSLNVDFEIGKKYKVKAIYKGRIKDCFEGELIQITKDHITLKSKFGYHEFFKKIDFKIKEYSIHEVV